MVTGKSHKPTKFTRFVLYPLAGVFFFCILVVVLTLANGYRFTYSNGEVGLTKTGMLILTTRPFDATITINGKLTKYKTGFHLLPTKIAGLKPGFYDVRVARKGYRTWIDTVEIKPNMVSWANYILLFPEKLNIAKINTPAGRVIATSDNGRHALFADNLAAFTLKSMDTNSLSVRNFWPDATPLEAWLVKPQILSAEYSSNSELALLRVANGARIEYVAVDATASPAKLIHLNATTKTDPTNVWWNTNRNDEVYVETAAGISLVGINATSLPAPILTGATYFEVDENKHILYVSKNATGTLSVDRMNPDGGNKTTLVPSVAAAKSYRLSYSQKIDRVAVLNRDTGELTSYYIGTAGKKTATVLSTGVTAYHWSKSGEYLYYYGRDFVRRFDFVKNKETVTPLTEVPTSIHWYFDENHYLVVNNKGVSVMDINGSNIVSIAGSDAKNSIYDNGNNNILYSVTDSVGKSSFYKFLSEF